MQANEILNEETGEVTTIDYKISDVVIREMKERFLQLKVEDFDDKKGYKECHEARMIVKQHRVAVEKRRKQLKEYSLNYGRKVDSVAKDLTFKLEEIEKHLENQQNVIDLEIERRKRERINGRAEKLKSVNCMMFNLAFLEKATDEEFEDLFLKEQERFNLEETARIAKEKELEELRLKEIENQKIIQELQEKERERERQRIEAIEQENKRLAQEAFERKQREQEQKQQVEVVAKSQIADDDLFEKIKRDFPTLELAWIEIAKLTKLLEL